MPRKKKVISKRQKVFDLVSKVIDYVQEKWRKILGTTLFLVCFAFFIYVVFFWIDTVQEIRFEIIYM